MIFALVSGSLFRAPEQRTSKAGKPFVTTTIRIKDADGSQFVHVTAFSESAQTELLRLVDGDALSVQGPLTVSTYRANDGAIKVSLSIIANHVLALRQPPRERTSKPAPDAPDTRSRQERCAGTWASERDGPNDPIDFGGEPR